MAPTKIFSLVDSLQDGIVRATAPLIARMDADDIAHPLRFENKLTYLKAARFALIGFRHSIYIISWG